MIHSQDVNICDKNYICFISVKALAFNLVFKYFTVTTTKSFMKSPSRFYACSYYSMTPRNRNFYIRFSRASKSRPAVLLCNYCTVPFYFVCCMALILYSFVVTWS